MNFKDLETRGYIVVPNFLSKEAVDRLTADYYAELASPPTEVYKRLGIATSSSSHRLDDLINHVMTQVRAETNIEIDFCYPSADYYNNNSFVAEYHQDHEPYWLWQDSYNSLNIWIPLIKTEEDKDGLFVVPADRIRRYHHLLTGRGAQHFVDNKDGSTLMFDDCLGKQYTLDLSLDALKEAPILYPGDALIMRADTIHASQPKTHLRVAASIRCANTQGWVDRSVAYNWVNNVWDYLIKRNDILYTNFFQKLSQEYANNERVQIGNIVLTNN